MSAGLRMFKEKWTSPTIPQILFTGQVVLITGANTGLGLELSKRVAALNAHKIIITVRSHAKGETAKKEIEQSLTKTDSQPEIVPLILDMSSAQGVIDFKQRLMETTDKLDVAVLNAGVISTHHNLSKDSFEETIQVNVASTILLAAELVPLLRATAETSGKQTHLNVVSSRNAAMPATFPTKADILNSGEPLSTLSRVDHFPAGAMGGGDQYSLSKLLLEYGLRRLVKSESLYDKSGQPLVILNSVCPGATLTDLGRNFDFPLASVVLRIWQAIFSKSVADGATIYLQALAQGDKSMGQLWSPETVWPDWEALKSQSGQKLGDDVWNELKGYMSKHDVSFVKVIESR